MSYHSVPRSFLLLAFVAGVAGRGTLAIGAISELSTGGGAVLVPGRTPAEAIAEIQNLGGSFARDERSPNKPVIRVILYGAQVTDARLKHLEGLTQLRTLTLSLTKVDDSGLQHLRGMSQLQRLSLTSTPITDAGLKHLKGLTQLQSLNLRRTQVTEAGVKELQKALPNCNITWTETLPRAAAAAAGGPEGPGGGWGGRGGRTATRNQRLAATFVAIGQRSSWSPDGKRIVFGRSGEDRGMLIYDIATNRATEFTTMGKDPAWSGTDGRWIAYVTGSGTAEAIWVTDARDSKPFRVASGCMPSWSAEGKTLFFQAFDRQQLVSTEVTGNGQFSPPRVRIAMPYRYPAVSPDGKLRGLQRWRRLGHSANQRRASPEAVRVAEGRRHTRGMVAGRSNVRLR